MNVSPSPMEALTAFNRQLLAHVVKPLAADGKTPDVPEMMRALADEPRRRLRSARKKSTIGTTSSSLPCGRASPRTRPEAKPPAVVQPEPGDRRFRAPEWQQPYFSFLAQSYLINARLLNELVESAQLDPKAKTQAPLLRAPVHRRRSRLPISPGAIRRRSSSQPRAKAKALRADLRISQAISNAGSSR